MVPPSESATGGGGEGGGDGDEGEEGEGIRGGDESSGDAIAYS